MGKQHQVLSRPPQSPFVAAMGFELREPTDRPQVAAAEVGRENRRFRLMDVALQCSQTVNLKCDRARGCQRVVCGRASEAVQRQARSIGRHRRISRGRPNRPPSFLLQRADLISPSRHRRCPAPAPDSISAARPARPFPPPPRDAPWDRRRTASRTRRSR
jgi:hypothetical protein